MGEMMTSPFWMWSWKRYEAENSQPALTCSKLTTETLEQGVKYFQS